MIVLRYAAVLLGTFHSVHAWGALGHATVAYIAQHYVRPNTMCWAHNILKDYSTDYLAANASWPDDFDHSPAGKWSGLFHFIDAHDCPPTVCKDKPTGCEVDYDRDCKSKGCVISAIMNYTQRVNNQKLDDEQVREALLFLVHFLGDITQPLHNEDIARGGNDIHVKFKGKPVNLHSTWDTFIPEAMNGGHRPLLPSAQVWAQTLIDAIDKTDGIYHLLSAGWIKGDDISKVKDSALRWSGEANALVCTVVMPNGPDVLRVGDLYPVYFNSAKDTVSLQIARAGYRLANWLNMLAPSYCKEGDSIYADAPSSQKPMSFDEEEL
ncbi:nuclease PA3 [Pyrenochaeta sp. MPI-SDFR-AT-0127]|nr:nuclease PA3 [Pyrenochaeta sp. MPI-SDFR-AT-0127]